jgi:D-arabinose 1-dehydrogenase-like Zn-dependent alcohol dehydrogenase
MSQTSRSETQVVRGTTAAVALAACVPAADAKKLELTSVPVKEPGPGQVSIRVHACGICHSDVVTFYNAWPGLTFPRVPGHEIAGTIEAIGPNVTSWNIGDRVGVGWHGGHDETCDRCRRGDFNTCVNLQVPGISYDGGYAQYTIVPANALARIPDALSFEEAAPLMCAGVTTFNALRHSVAVPGDVVAVLGIGGLGHLGVQYAAKMGFHTVAIARGADKESDAVQLGAKQYIDSQASDAAAELQKIGGAKVVLSTITSAAAMAPLIGGLESDGQLMIVGASSEPLCINTGPMFPLKRRNSIKVWLSGTATDSEDTMNFSVLTGVRAWMETMPLERVSEAFQRMLDGTARFRMVLTMT